LAKIAIGLWLLLVGAVIGYFIGRGCSYHRYHEMIACPMPVAPMENAAPGNPGKPQ